MGLTKVQRKQLEKEIKQMAEKNAPTKEIVAYYDKKAGTHYFDRMFSVVT